MSIRVDEVSVRIDDAELLTRVSFEVPTGTTLGLVGPNGSGKSTLLRALYRDVSPSGGAVHVDGAAVAESAPAELARTVAVLAQHEGLALDFTVAEVVALGRHPHPHDRGADERIIATAMALTETAHLARRSVLSLSGGERQRVMLARALTQDCPVLLLDEPTNHLDLRHQLRVVAKIARGPRTIVIALHDLNLAAAVCDRIALLDRGRLLAVGDPAEVLRPDLIEQVYGVRPAVVTHPDDGSHHLIFSPEP